jgi:hypothetical protein
VPGVVNPGVGCSGTGQGDTTIIVFTNHPDALAYAHRMIATKAAIGTPGAVVVGPNWAVNTSYGFAPQVVKAVGGQVLMN